MAVDKTLLVVRGCILQTNIHKQRETIFVVILATKSRIQIRPQRSTSTTKPNYLKLWDITRPGEIAMDSRSAIRFLFTVPHIIFFCLIHLPLPRTKKNIIIKRNKETFMASLFFFCNQKEKEKPYMFLHFFSRQYTTESEHVSRNVVKGLHLNVNPLII